ASLRTESRINEILDYDSTRLHLFSGFLGAEVLGSLEHLRSLSTETVTRQVLDSRTPEHLQSLESSFLMLAQRNPQYQQIRWIDESGIEKVRVMRDQGDPYVVALQELQDKSERYYFEAANALLPGELYISPIDLNVEHGQTEMPPKPMLRIATPVEDSNRERRGIIIINIAMKHLFDLIRNPELPEADYLLVNQQGTLLNDEVENFPAADEEDQTVNVTLSHPDIWKRVSVSDSGSLELPDGLWTWKTLSPVDTFYSLSRAFPQHLTAFDESIKDNFSLTLVAHRPISTLLNLRRDIRMLVSLGVFFILSVYGLSLFLFLSGHARARHAEVDAAYAMARASNMVRMKELEERFHRLVEASSIGQMVVDDDGLIEISNPAAERILGYEKGELEGIQVDTLLPASMQLKHSQQRKQFIQAPEARKMGEGRKLQAVRKDGSSIPVEIGLNPYTDHDRQLILVSIIDLSVRKDTIELIDEKEFV
ncbi:MAG: PAS domain S-box protein, partial [Gammaproteobacteria bacterium]